MKTTVTQHTRKLVFPTEVFLSVSAFITTVKVLTTIAQVVLRLSPVPELYLVHKRKDVGVMALMPTEDKRICTVPHLNSSITCTTLHAYYDCLDERLHAYQLRVSLHFGFSAAGPHRSGLFKMVSAFITTVKVLTTIAQVVLRLSPVPELYRVHKRKDVGVMALMPIVSMLLCNHIWLIYAYAVENFFPLFSVCVFGDVVVTLYVIIYAKWCSNRAYVVKLVVMAGIPFVLISTYVILVASGVINQSRHQFGLVLGYVANVATFAMYISPFEKLKLVIETKSSAAIPVLLCGIIFVNCALWLINGIVDNDLFIVVPNIAGVLLSATQITLFFIYCPKETMSSSDTNESEIDAVVALEKGTTDQVSTPNSLAFTTLVSPTMFVKTSQFEAYKL